MRIERTVNFSAKLHNLMQYASLNNTGSTTLLGGSLPNINSYMIQGMLSGGLSEQTIIDELLSYIGIDPENESLSKVVSNALGKIIKSVERDLEEKPDENTADDNQNTALTESPIDEFEFDWNIEDTGELFSEDISKENFIENFDVLNSSINENDYFSNYLSAINEIGADNFFSVLDSDNDGKLSAEELSALTNADENDKTISAEEFNNIYNKYLGNTIP